MRLRLLVDHLRSRVVGRRGQGKEKPQAAPTWGFSGTEKGPLPWPERRSLLRLWSKEDIIREGQSIVRWIQRVERGKDKPGDPPRREEDHNGPVRPLGRLTCIGVLGGPCGKLDLIFSSLSLVCDPTPQAL